MKPARTIKVMIQTRPIDISLRSFASGFMYFLYKSKVMIVAAEFIMSRVPEATVTPHFCRIEEKDSEFYRQFQIIILGLDSVQARRWMNAKVFSLLIYNDDGNLLPESIRPIIDGGTEGFRGHCRVICPNMTACLECNLDLFPPQGKTPGLSQS